MQDVYKRQGTDYTGIYFVGSEALELDLPNTEIDVFILDTSIELGAFGGTGTKNDKQHLYLAIGANAVVKSLSLIHILERDQ